MAKTLALDVDGVLAKGYLVMDGAVEGVRCLREAGWTVIIHTARAWNLVETVEWLRAVGIEVDMVALKPLADVYVDDRGYRFESWEKLLEDLL